MAQCLRSTRLCRSVLPGLAGGAAMLFATVTVSVTVSPTAIAMPAPQSTGAASEQEPIGPASGARDATYLARLRAHQKLGKQGRAPSPPDGPDQTPDAGRNGAQCESSIAIDPTDELHAVGAAIDFATGSALTTWYTTFDGGLTWTSGVILNEPGFGFNGDCSVVITPSGVPVITLLQYYGAGGSAVDAYRSLDGGLTWQAPVLVDLDGSNDKVSSATDRSNGPHRGQIAVAWDRFFTAQGDTIWTAVSDDDGATWRDVQRVNDTNGEAGISPDVAYGPNSELWVMWADRGQYEVVVDKSLDGGTTFGTDIIAGTYLQVPSTLPNNFFRLFDIFSITVDMTAGPYSGSVYVAYHRWNKPATNADIYVLRSHDGGATWKKNFVNVGDATNSHQVMPWAEVDEHGNLNISFWDCRLDPNNYLLWNWVARSSDGGLHWREYPVSDAGFDYANTDGWYLGDYIGFDVSAHFSRPFFPDGGSGSLDMTSDEIHLDLHTDVDVLSAATGGVVAFDLNVGPNHAGENYWLLGSFSTTTGIDIGSVHLPLDYDGLFELTLDQANTALFVNSLGVLDATGSAAITIDTGGPFDPALSGQNSYWSAYVWAAKPVYATNATVIAIVP